MGWDGMGWGWDARLADPRQGKVSLAFAPARGQLHQHGRASSRQAWTHVRMHGRTDVH